MFSEREAATDEIEDFCRDRYPKLVGALSLYCGQADVAEELAQETLVRVVRDWRKVKRLDSPEAWVHRVGVNLANSFFRRRAAEARATKRLADGYNQAIPPTRAEDVAIRQAVAALPRRQKTALILRYYAGCSVRETAEAMGCPEGTVKTLTHKAIANLRGLPQIQGLREGAT